MTEDEQLDRIKAALVAAGDGDFDVGLRLFREAMIARRNAGIFYRFAAWAGGALVGSLVFGKQLIEGIQFFLAFKFGGR